MRGVIAVIALVAGCEPQSQTCEGGWVCPASYACAQAPIYCGDPEQVAKCDGQADWATCAFGEASQGTCRAGVCEACNADREGCPGPNAGWFAMTSPVAADLFAISVPRQGEAYAVGAGGTLLGYDGTAWRAIATTPPLPGDLISVWASGADNIYVVSTESAHNVMHVAGGAWTDVAMPSGAAAIKAIDGTASDDLHAVGTMGTIADFDGTQWTLANGAPGPTFIAVHAAARGSAMAVANGGGYVATLSGSAWTVAQPLAASTLATGVWASATEAVVVGPSATTGDPPVLDYYAGTWSTPTLQPATAVVGRKLYGALGTPDAIYAVGTLGLIVKSDRTSWTALQTTPTQNDLRAIAASSPTDLFVVGAGGVILRSLGN